MIFDYVFGLFKFTKIQRQARALLKNARLFVMLYGGSRSGKTAFFVWLIFMRAGKANGSRHLIARFRFNHAKTSLWYDTIPKVAKLMGIYDELDFNKSDWFIKYRDSEIWIAGLDDKERVEKILGNEYATIYLNEASQISWSSVGMVLTRLAQKTILKNLMLIDCNPPVKTHWLYQVFKLYRDPVTRVPFPEDQRDKYISMRMNPADNVENISETYMDILESLSVRQRKRFKDGEFLDEVDGALWKPDYIDNNRMAEGEIAENIIRTAVAIDPNTASNPKASGETGIMVGGVDDRSPAHGYVFADLSGHYLPHEWAKVAVDAYYEYECSCIVAEANQGGEMVRHTIHSVDPNILVILVHASKGKIVRAEPISAIYEQGRVHHAAFFADLEEQLTTYTGAPAEKSPDRLDALVWLLTYLMVGLQKTDDAGPSTSGGSFDIPR